MRLRFLMLLFFAANAHNFLWVLGALDESKVTKHLNRMEMDQYMDVLELKSMIYKILQGNDKNINRLDKVEKMEETLELVKTQVQNIANQSKLPECERWLQTENLNRTNFFSAEGEYFYIDLTNLNWISTLEWCTERAMKMAMLKFTSQMNIVAKELKERTPGNNYFWLAASDLGQTPKRFHWVDGTLVDGTTWTDGKISKLQGNVNETTCVQFVHGFAKLSDARCSWGRFIMCQVPSALAACL